MPRRGRRSAPIGYRRLSRRLSQSATPRYSFSPLPYLLFSLLKSHPNSAPHLLVLDIGIGNIYTLATFLSLLN